MNEEEGGNSVGQGGGGVGRFATCLETGWKNGRDPERPSGVSRAPPNPPHPRNRHSEQRRDPPLFTPPDNAGGRHGRAVEAEGSAGVVDRRRRVGLPLGSVSGSRGRGHGGRRGP